MNKKLQSFLWLLFLPLFALAQSVVSGTVKEAGTGLPVTGASVLVKGSGLGTATDFDGKYTLTNVADGATIVFSYLGYTTQEILFTGQSTIDVMLVEDTSELEEVVLIGYGSVKQANVTSAQTTVKSEEFNKGAIVSPGQLIAGKAAGVQVTAASGRPGDGPVIRVRPGSTLSGSQDALYVVDGIPLDQQNASLNSINPNDIESITILKDASATAIYGNRASNGVVLITTKKAALSSELKVRYDMQFAVEKVDRYVHVLDSFEFLQMVSTQGRDTSILGNASTDWQDAIYENATRGIHNISLEKGYDNTTVRASLGYVNENGTLLGSGYERASLGLNVSHRMLDNDLKLTFTSQFAQEEIRNADQGAIGAAVVFDPTQPIRSGNNLYGGFFEFTNSTGPEPNAPRNPLGLLNSLDSETDNSQARMNLNAMYNTPVEGLTFTGNAGIDYNEFNSFSLRDSNSGAGARFASQDYSRGIRRNSMLDGRLDYKKYVENIDTDIELTAGGQYQEFFRQSFNRSLDRSTGQLEDRLSTPSRDWVASYFTRASFDIKDRLVLSGSFSRNASSKFSENNRWANFYGASAAIKLTETAFVQNSKFLSRLKLRGGFGRTGQQEVPVNFLYLQAFDLAEPGAAVQFGDRFLSPIRPRYSADLVWETTDQWNVGIDLGFFDDRVTASVDAFYRDTFDLLVNGPIAAGALANFSIQNAGSTLSRGIETNVNVKVIDNDKLSWNLGGNITFQEIEITDLAGPNNDPVAVGGISGGVGNLIQEWAVGSDPTAFHVYRQVYDQNGLPLAGVYVDVNGDNVINEADRVRYKKANHDAYFGFNTNLTYGRFDLNATFRGAFGGYNYNNVASNAANYGSTFPTNTQNPIYINAPRDILNSDFTDQELFSDYYVQRADFVKLDNLSLGYNFPGDKVDIRASITGTNLFTITPYDGVDPEVFGGIDNNLFPRNRGLIFGLGFNF
jgi:iron complex outermembrane receptor protein